MNEWFTTFASRASNLVAKPWFFAFCLLLVIVWLPSYFALQSIDTWQLIINTVTTIVTFLLVALLQNDQERFQKSVNAKLNAIAMGIGDLLEKQGQDEQAQELYDVMGLEDEITA